VRNSSSFFSGLYIAAYFGIWAVFFLLLRSQTGFESGEALAALLILGGIFPALSLLATRPVRAEPSAVFWPLSETAVLLFYLGVITLMLVWGVGALARITAEPLHSVAWLGVKLAIAVVVPLAMGRAAGYKIRELAPASWTWFRLKPALWMSLAILLLQSFLGRGLRDLRAAHLPVWSIVVAAPLCFAWLGFEAGLVEEFFFRALLQERLARVLRSGWGGLVVSALLFGLVHAPGLYLRPAATQEGIGSSPTLLLAVGYSVVMTSLGGLFLGVLWMRTRNLAAVVLVHAAGDFLPNLLPRMKAFHLGS